MTKNTLPDDIGPWEIINGLARAYPDLKDSDYRLLMWLFARWEKTTGEYRTWSHAEMARELGGSASKWKRAAHRLRELGLLTWTSKGNGTRNSYIIRADAIADAYREFLAEGSSEYGQFQQRYKERMLSDFGVAFEFDDRSAKQAEAVYDSLAVYDEGADVADWICDHWQDIRECYRAQPWRKRIAKRPDMPFLRKQVNLSLLGRILYSRQGGRSWAEVQKVCSRV